MNRKTWSDLTIDSISNHLDGLITGMPALEHRLTYRSARGSKVGSDIVVQLNGAYGNQHMLLFEIEQYASGKGLQNKVKTWAKRHIKKPNTTTIVISLVLQALRNRLVNEFSMDSDIRNMVFSNEFRMFPGSGDGRIPDELKYFLTWWIEQRI